MGIQIEEQKKRMAWQRIGNLESFDEMKLMKIREGIKYILDNLKANKRETYDDVITKLIIKYGAIEGKIPKEILMTLQDRLTEIDNGKVYSFKEAHKKIFSK